MGGRTAFASGSTAPMTGDPRCGRRPARYRDDGSMPCHYLDLATGEWVAAIVDWAPEGEPIRTEAEVRSSRSSRCI
jgi:hypothetical protein